MLRIMTTTTVVLFVFCGYLELAQSKDSSSTIIPPLLSSTVRSLHEKFTTTDSGLTKRNIKLEEISKSFDPSPEYYVNNRGQGSSYDRNRDGGGRPGSNFIHESSSRFSSAPPKGGSSTSSSYNDHKNKNIHDRLSIGHVSNSLSSGYGSNSIGGSSSHYEPYENSVQPVEYSSGQYTGSSGSSVGGGGGGGGGHYQGGSHGGSTGYAYEMSHKGFEDYGAGNSEYGHGGSSANYYGGHGGGGYGGGGGDYGGKSELKKLLLPLAGVAVLGVAAVLFANPFLLQLGTISTPFGKRKRRDLSTKVNSENDLAYRGYSQH